MTRWFLQGPDDQTCTAIYGGDTVPALGTDTPYPEGSRVALMIISNNDENPKHYSIDDSGNLVYLLAPPADLSKPDFNSFRNRIYADIKAGTLPPSCVVFTETLIQAFTASADKAKDYWANFVQEQALTVDQMTQIQNDAIASRMGLIEVAMPKPKPVPTVSPDQLSAFLADCATDSAIPGDGDTNALLALLALIQDDTARKAQWAKSQSNYSSLVQNAIVQHAAKAGIALQ